MKPGRAVKFAGGGEEGQDRCQHAPSTQGERDAKLRPSRAPGQGGVVAGVRTGCLWQGREEAGAAGQVAGMKERSRAVKRPGL